MNHSNWSALALVICVGACRGPEPEAEPTAFGTQAGREVPDSHGRLIGVGPAGVAGDREMALLQGPMTFGEQCDIEVRAVDSHPGVLSGWPRGGDDFVIRPKQDADWVNPVNGNRIKFLASSQMQRVSIDSNSGTVTIGGTPFPVARHLLPFSSDVQGIAVNIAGADSKELILWLIVDQYAYKVVLRDR